MKLQELKDKYPDADFSQPYHKYALLAHCGSLSIVFYPSMEEALIGKKTIDLMACGGDCIDAHEILELEV